jgi:hypothetical protein
VNAIVRLQAAGFAFSVQGEKVTYRWTRTEPPDPEQVGPLLVELKANVCQAREFLTMQPGQCHNCPAAGHWDGYSRWRMAPGRYCFYSAIFEGKAARPVLAAWATNACPKNPSTKS